MFPAFGSCAEIPIELAPEGMEIAQAEAWAATMTVTGMSSVFSKLRFGSERQMELSRDGLLCAGTM